MNKFADINFKALIIGAAIGAIFILFGWKIKDLFYPFASIGLFYAGYGQHDIKIGTLAGAVASIPIIILTFQGCMGSFDGFFLTGNGMLVLALLIIVIGALVGFVGAWTKRSRLEKYEKKQNIGKNKKKKKNKK